LGLQRKNFSITPESSERILWNSPCLNFFSRISFILFFLLVKESNNNNVSLVFCIRFSISFCEEHVPKVLRKITEDENYRLYPELQFSSGLIEWMRSLKWLRIEDERLFWLWNITNLLLPVSTRAPDRCGLRNRTYTTNLVQF